VIASGSERVSRRTERAGAQIPSRFRDLRFTSATRLVRLEAETELLTLEESHLTRRGFGTLLRLIRALPVATG
jgi:hypothetical protein